MGKTWTKTKLFFNLILLAKNPYKAELALRLNPLLIELGCLKHSLEVVRSVEAKIQPEKHLLAKINLQELKTRPPGSLDTSV